MYNKQYYYVEPQHYPEEVRYLVIREYEDEPDVWMPAMYFTTLTEAQAYADEANTKELQYHREVQYQEECNAIEASFDNTEEDPYINYDELCYDIPF